MKKIVLLILLALLSIIVWNSSFQENTTAVKQKTNVDNEQRGYVYFCQGKISINGQEQNCKTILNDPVFETDTIRTKKASLIKLKMIDDSLLTIGPKSYIKLKEYSVKTKNNKNVLINLIKGFIHVNVKNKVSNGKFEVKTRSAVMGVRGTEFTAEYRNKTTDLYLFHGLVHVSKESDIKNSFFLNPEERVQILDNKFEDKKVQKVKRQWVKKKEREFSRSSHVPDFDNFYKNSITEIKKNTSTRSPSSIKRIFFPKSTKSKEKIINKNPVNDILEFRKKSQSSKENKKLYSKKIGDFLNSKYSNSKGRVELNLDNSVESEILRKEIKKYSKEKISEQESKLKILNKRDIALPLIKPDGSIVFFEEREDIENLKKDKNGDIIGIKVDENLIPIADIVLLDDTLEDYREKDQKIKIINESGDIEEIPAVNEYENKIIDIPSIPKSPNLEINGRMEDQKRSEDTVAMEAKNPLGQENKTEDMIENEESSEDPYYDSYEYETVLEGYADYKNQGQAISQANKDHKNDQDLLKKLKSDIKNIYKLK